MNPLLDVDPKLMKWFDALRTVPGRDPQRAAAGRAAYLQQVDQIGTGPIQPPKRRRAGLFSFRLWRPAMQLTALALLLVVMIVSVGGAAAAAAQPSLPGQPLYGLKLYSEQAWLRLNTGTQQEWRVMLALAERRGAEIQDLVENGQQPPEALLTRYRLQLEAALRLGAGLPAGQLEPALGEIRLRLQTREQAALRIQNMANAQGATVMAQMRSMLQECVRWIELGIQDPVQLRVQFRLQPFGGPVGTPPANAAPGAGSGPGPNQTDCPSCTPGTQDGNREQYGSPQPAYGSPQPTYAPGGPQQTPAGPGYQTPGLNQPGEPGAGPGPLNTPEPPGGPGPGEGQGAQLQVQPGEQTGPGTGKP
jgi:hypothetical protein